MRPNHLSLLFLLAASPVAAQSPGLREIERSCSRVTDDPRPPNIEALEPLIAGEAGARASFLRGCKLLAEQKFGLAGGEFEKAVRAEPGVAVYHFWFGRATGEQAQRANALRQPGLARRTKGEFEKAVALDSSYVAPREGLLRYYLAAPGFLGGSVAAARAQAVEIATINPYRGGLAHGNVAVAARDTAGLIRIHEELVAAYPDSASSYFTLLNVQVTRKQWGLTWNVIERLERARPDLPILQYAIGRVAAESGEQLDRGAASLRGYLSHTPAPNEPSHAATHWRLGMIAERRGDRTAARQSYETATTLDPNFRQAKEALSRLK